MSCFFDFSYSLKLCIPVHNWNCSHKLQSLLIDFGEGIPSLRPVTFYWGLVIFAYAGSTLTVSSCGIIPKLVCHLSILQCTRLCVGSLLFCFSKGGSKAQVCGLLLATDLGQFSVYAHMPKLLSLLLGVPQSQQGQAGYGEICRVLGVPVGQLVGSTQEAFPAFHKWTCWRSLQGS